MAERRLKLSRAEIEQAKTADQPWPLPNRARRHLQRVLRLSDGTKVEVFDGEGSRWEATYIVSGGVGSLVGWVTLPEIQALPETWLAVALLKPTRWEWLIEKATELGATTVVPLRTELTAQRIPAERLESRLGRWRRISDEAARQCGRVDELTIMTPMSLAELRGVGPERWWMADEAEAERPTPPLRKAEAVGVLIGPEGGWTDSERASLSDRVESFGLGPLILRAETAAVAALSRVWGQRLS